MQLSAVSSTATGSGSSAAALNTIDADDFLTLLVTEMQSQDPLDPMDTTAMVQQLSQMELVAETRMAREGQDFSQGLGLIGRTVQWLDSTTGVLRGGTVEGVLRDGSTTLLAVGNYTLKLTELLAIS